MSKQLLVLDVDGTLIYGSPDPSADGSDDFAVVAEGQTIWIKRRPGLNDFLKFCKENYDLAVWSSGTKEYIEKILAVIGLEVADLKYFFTRKDCVLKFLKTQAPDECEDRAMIIKPLNIIWKHGHYASHDTMILDDTPETYQENKEHAIPIYSYRGEDDDTGLYLATRILEKVLRSRFREKFLETW